MPFFTTKDISCTGKGTGLGLASVYGIVKQSGGYISVDSRIGRGTTFNIYLPRVDEEQVEPERSEKPLGYSRATAATALVVEDSEIFRVTMPRVLENAKFNVLLAANGIEALQIAARYQGPIHLLITDVMMPRLRGTEPAARLIASRPEMKVLYMSSYSTDILGKQPRRLLKNHCHPQSRCGKKQGCEETISNCKRGCSAMWRWKIGFQRIIRYAG